MYTYNKIHASNCIQFNRCDCCLVGLGTGEVSKIPTNIKNLYGVDIYVSTSQCPSVLCGIRANLDNGQGVDLSLTNRICATQCYGARCSKCALAKQIFT